MIAITGNQIDDQDEDAESTSSKVSYYIEDELTGKIKKLLIDKNSTTYLELQKVIKFSKIQFRDEFERQATEREAIEKDIGEKESVEVQKDFESTKLVQKASVGLIMSEFTMEVAKDKISDKNGAVSPIKEEE